MLEYDPIFSYLVEPTNLDSVSVCLLCRAIVPHSHHIDDTKRVGKHATPNFAVDVWSRI